MATFGVGLVKKKRENLGSTAPSFYSAATWTAWLQPLFHGVQFCYFLLHTYITSPSYLFCIFKKQVWSMELVRISAFVCAGKQCSLIGMVLQSKCWGHNIHCIHVGGLFWTTCKWWFRCCLGVYLSLNFIRKIPTLYTLRLLYNVKHDIVNGTDLKEKYSPTVS